MKSTRRRPELASIPDVSHNPQRLFAVADRIVVLHGGRVAGSCEKVGATHSDIVVVGAQMEAAT